MSEATGSRRGDDAADVAVRASEAVAARRRRLAAMGETLAVASTDETDEGWSEVSSGARNPGGRDDEMRRDVPPHHN